MPVRDAGIEQLALGRHGQVEVKLAAEPMVSGGARRQEQERIFLAHLVVLHDFVEKLGGVGELRFEGVAHFVAHRVAAGGDARPDGGADVAGIAAVFAAQHADRLFHDALHQAAPPGVDGSDRPLLCVHQQHRHAIGSLDRQHRSGHVSHQRVAGERMRRWAVHPHNEVGVDLPAGDHRPGASAGPGADGPEECGPVSFHGLARVAMSEAKVEGAATVSG